MAIENIYGVSGRAVIQKKLTNLTDIPSNGTEGLANWVKQFFASELAVMPEDIQVTVIKKVEELARETLWNGKEWVADYRRLRAIAHL